MATALGFASSTRKAINKVFTNGKVTLPGLLSVTSTVSFRFIITSIYNSFKTNAFEFNLNYRQHHFLQRQSLSRTSRISNNLRFTAGTQNKKASLTCLRTL